MPSKYWIKLYHEVLHDPKMGRLPDNLWRRVIELFLLAGEVDQKGKLPPLEEMAWILRQPDNTLEQELAQLVKIGIIMQVDKTWTVTNFDKRQGAVTDAERMKRYRERKTKQEPNAQGNVAGIRNVTGDVTKRNIDTDTESESIIPAETTRAGKQENKHSPNGKQASLNQVMFSALASVCKINWKVATEEQRGQLNQSEKILREDGAVPQDLVDFGTWWEKYDWRGKQGQAPTPSQVRETWGQFLASKDEKKRKVVIT